MGSIQGQSVRQTLRHNRQGFWPLHEAGKPVRRVPTWLREVPVADKCGVAVGHNSAMAVEDSIPVTGVEYTRLDMDWEEGSMELKSHHRSVRALIYGRTCNADYSSQCQ